MSLKRRNILVLILLFIVAGSWSLGLSILKSTHNSNTISETTMPTAEYSESYSTVYVPSSDEAYTRPTQDSLTGESYVRPQSRRIVGTALCFVGALCAIAVVFLLRQASPFFGPDGIFLLSAFLILWIHSIFFSGYTAGYLFFISLAVIIAIRELWGWVRSSFALSWCLACRLSGRFAAPQLSLSILTGLILLSVSGMIFSWQVALFLPLFCFGVAGGLDFGCLFQYGSVLQAQNEEAVRTAVISERFKVELISNVSHDLRTPLTSILGYSELLQKESLSPEGREQLNRLYQKAGYMNDLVDSLFELTKVSSGVLESKKEELDLIRLLEQTIGLFDDQLTKHGLSVRRSYEADSVPVLTDGARMHQVFSNLLGNAIKYALPCTRIYLEVKETPEAYSVRMTNTASYEMDFKPEEIMQRFARGDKARSTKGSGIGLAIAQTYTESVGGSFHILIDGDQFNAIVNLPRSF